MVDSVREQLLASHEEFRRLARTYSTLPASSLPDREKILDGDEKLEEVRIRR